MEFKVNFGDPKTGKTVKKVISEDQAQVFLKKRIGDKINGKDIGFEGYEFEITGGSDYCGFPMRRDVIGASRKRVLMVSGVGIRKKKRKGRKVRKTVAGNTIHPKTAQINLKILKMGSKPLAEEKPAEGGEKAPKAEKKEEKPKEEKKPEAKAEAPKKEKPKKEDKPVEKPKKEEKPPEPKKKV